MNSAMKRFVVIGNCQRESLINLLKLSHGFSSNYQELAVPPVFLMKDLHFEKLRVELPRIDFVVYQPILSLDFKTASSEYIESVVPNEKRIKIPNAFFQGYHPDLVEIKLLDKDFWLYPKLEKIGSYHSATLMELFNSGVSAKDALSIVKELTPEIENRICKISKDSIKELSEREKNNCVNVQLSEYISSNFRRKKLFHIHNHPSNEVVKIIAEGVADRFLLPLTGFSCQDNEFHGYTQPPILPIVKDALKLDFSFESALVNGKSTPLFDWIKACFNFYSEINNFNDFYTNRYSVKSLI